MKITKILKLSCLVITLLFLNTVLTKKAKKKSHNTPKGDTLRNHYGTPFLSSPYGPKTDNIATYVENNPDNFTPFLGEKNRQKLLRANDFPAYPGYENKLVPGPVKAGEYTNIAPSATHEVNPEITNPKLEVNGEITYPAATKVPVFQGFAKEQHPIIAFDKLTGEIIEDNVLIKRPVYNYENRVSNVSRHFSKYYDLRDGKKMTLYPKLKKHGIDTVNPDDWKAPSKHDKCKKGNLRKH